MILISTPNGKVGSEIVKMLLEQGQPVRLGAHTLEKAQNAFPQTEVVPFDFGDEGEVKAALQDVQALYLAAPGDAQAASVNRVIDLAKLASSAPCGFRRWASNIVTTRCTTLKNTLKRRD